jgi:hypothetical protein
MPHCRHLGPFSWTFRRLSTRGGVVYRNWSRQAAVRFNTIEKRFASLRRRLMPAQNVAKDRDASLVVAIQSFVVPAHEARRRLP